jgi:SAM-dependent methyltransferase
MSHLHYYRYQAVARGVFGPQDVIRLAALQAHIYDRLVLPWLPADHGARMADLGCGHGSFLYWLRERGFRELTGVDSSREQVLLARSMGFEIVEAEVIGWLEQQPPASREALFAIDFIEHVSKDDFMRLLQAGGRVLASKGRLILRYPNADSPFVGLNLFNDITHVWTYTTVCLQILASMHGFARCRFVDEGIGAIRDQRWLKVPVARLAALILRLLFQAVSRERIRYWSASIWACLEKG